MKTIQPIIDLESTSARANTFLRFGYFLDYQPKLNFLKGLRIDRDKYRYASEVELSRLAGDAFRRAVCKLLPSGRENLVPLSGGLDSRAILATLLEHIPASNISTYTFGVPGTFDFDIGNLVAAAAGTKHRSYNLNNHAFRYDELEDIADRVSYQTVLFHHWPVWAVDRDYPEHVIWSGFLGDPLTGSHLPAEASTNTSDALLHFVQANKFSNMSLGRIDDITDHVSMPFLPYTTLSFEEQLDLLNRQVKYVSPQVLMNGYHFKTPFLDRDFTELFLSIPTELRRGQHLYKRMLVETFPFLFSLPTKSNRGLPINAGGLARTIQNFRVLLRSKLGGPRPGLNYLPFAQAIRSRPDLRELVGKLVNSLAQRRELKLNRVNALLNEHLSDIRDHSNLLLGLATLELYIRKGVAL